MKKAGKDVAVLCLRLRCRKSLPISSNLPAAYFSFSPATTLKLKGAEVFNSSVVLKRKKKPLLWGAEEMWSGLCEDLGIGKEPVPCLPLGPLPSQTS